MTALQWGCIVGLLLSMCVTVAMVGKPRKTTTAGEAACIVLVDAALLLCVVLS